MSIGVLRPRVKPRRPRTGTRPSTELFLGAKQIKRLLDSADRLRDRLVRFLDGHPRGCRCGLCRQVARNEREAFANPGDPDVIEMMRGIASTLYCVVGLAEGERPRA